MGNLTLASKSWNSGIGNRLFSAKKEKYQNSVLRIQKELSDFSNVIYKVRIALRKAGYENVYLFQNEDSSDHFHLWMVPIEFKYELKGPHSLVKLLERKHNVTGTSQMNDVIEVLTRLRKAIA